MEISSLQQELMVAALSCGGNARTEYNDFQLSWKKALQHADKKMLAAFQNILGATGEKAYHTFKTTLATRAELRRINNVPTYCAAAHYKAIALSALSQAFTQSPVSPESRRASLQSFATAAEPRDFIWPVSPCAPKLTENTASFPAIHQVSSTSQHQK